jgi:poly(3-hydroxybutyrate) depolymerase
MAVTVVTSARFMETFALARFALVIGSAVVALLVLARRVRASKRQITRNQQNTNVISLDVARRARRRRRGGPATTPSRKVWVIFVHGQTANQATQARHLRS